MRLERSASRLQRRGFRGVRRLRFDIAQLFSCFALMQAGRLRSSRVRRPKVGLKPPDSKPYFSARYFSIACDTSSLSGFTLGSKRATTCPLRSTRNLLKFHLISPAKSGFVSLLV